MQQVSSALSLSAMKLYKHHLIFAGLPFFIEYPTPMTVVNGSDIQLECLVGGEPPPMITWLKDFTVLNTTSEPGIQIEENGTLIIMDAIFEDSGFYTCAADNGFGINQVSVSVEVIPELTPNKTGW